MIPHAVVGISIFAAMCARLWLRLRRGVPPPPAAEPRWMQFLSQANHWAFYGVLLLMPPLGLLALVTLQPVFGPLHSGLVWVLLALMLLNVAGAVLHWLRPGSTAHRRMLRAYSDGPRAD